MMIPQDPPGLQSRWIIECPAYALTLLTPAMGLSANAVEAVMDDGRGGVEAGVAPARLTFPSPHCRQSWQWLGVLAELVQRGFPFTLFLMTVSGTGRSETLQSLVQLFPKFDAQTRSLLRSFSPGMVEEADGLQARVALAFERLRGGTFPGRR